MYPETRNSVTSPPMNFPSQQPETVQSGASNHLLGLLQRKDTERHESLSPTADIWKSKDTNPSNRELGKQFNISNFATGVNTVTSPSAVDIWATPNLSVDEKQTDAVVSCLIC